MAATDQVYRNQKALNLVFAVSCVLMFLSIIWMLVDDYNREFKKVQRKFRDVETQLSLGQMLENMPDDDALRTGQDKVLELRKIRDDKRKQLESEHRDLIAKRDQAEATYQRWKADNDAAASYLVIARDDYEAATTPGERKAAKDRVAEREKQLNEIKTKTDEAESAFQKAHLDVEAAVTSKLTEEEKALSEAEDDLKNLSGAFDRFAKLAAEKRWKFGDTFRNLPIIDGFAAPTRIDQIVLYDLPIEYGSFKEVTRYDRCATCHLAIDRANFDRKSLFALGDEARADKLQGRLDTARDVLKDRAKKGEKLGFDPDDLPKKVTPIKLTAAQVTQFAAHPRLDLFADGNSPHPKEKFGCTICHAGQGSATDFKYSVHSPNDPEQQKEWEKHGWERSHDWDFPMLPKRFVESSCAKCHHEMTDLVRFGSREEAPKLLEGYNLVRENGCFGCHEIAGLKRGRAIGPDLRLEPTPPLEWLPANEQATLKADTLNPPGTMRKVGPSLRRLADKLGPKVNDWLLSWIDNPRHYRPDTKMPRFYGLSTNSKQALKEYDERQQGKEARQEPYPDAEIRSIAHYLITESNRHLAGEDSTRGAVRQDIERIHKKLHRLAVLRDKGKLSAKETSELDRLQRDYPRDRKDLDKLSVRWRDLCLMSRPSNFVEINRAGEELQKQHERIYDLLMLQDKLVKLKKERDALKGKLSRDEAARLRTVRQLISSVTSTITEDMKVFKDARPKEERKGKEAGAQSLAEAVVDLKDASEPLPPVSKAKELIGEDGRPVPVSEVPAPSKDTEVGHRLFTTKGCLACHSSADAPVPRWEDGRASKPKLLSDAAFAPNLSNLAGKIPEGKDGRLWLIQWVMNPNVHHPRTRMPVTHLNVKEAAEIADWLLSHKDPNWKPTKVDKPKLETLQELARASLLKSPNITRQEVEDVLNKGLSKEQIKRLAADADELALAGRGPNGEPVYKAGKIDDERLMLYIGKKAVSRQGCFGCHDVPGFENAKPIGTPLNDWGKKDPDRIAFEDAGSFVKEHFNIVERRDSKEEDKKLSLAWASAAGTPAPEWKSADGKPPYEEFYSEALEHHQREGFLHLKLLDPRSYDFNRVRNWEDRLRMPQFRFAKMRQRYDNKNQPESVDKYSARRRNQSAGKYDDRELYEEARAREAVMTFILGLVADPIPLKFVSQPRAERLAEVRGRQVLEKYNCAGCHELRPGTYEFNLPTDPKALDTLLTDFDAKLKDDKDFPLRDSNAWVARPSPITGQMFAYGVSSDDSPALRKEGKREFYAMRLTQALRFTDRKGMVQDLPAGTQFELPADVVNFHSKEFGGRLAKLIGPYLKTVDSNFADLSGWRAALPPPLVREGERVQPQWLYKFLRDPFAVRPWTVLRMPRFNMSEDEARTLVDYFGAVDKLENPAAALSESYLTIPQQEANYWKEKNAAYIARLKRDYKTSSNSRDLPKLWWQRDVTGRLERQKKALAEAEAAVKGASDAKQKEQLQKQRDALKKEVDSLQAEADRVKKGEFSSADFKAFQREWKEGEVYATDAYRLLTDANTVCISCHSIGDLKVTGAKGPDLDLGHERLRPRWTKQWIANPNRLSTYPSFMPQNLPNDQPGALHPFAGTPLEAVVSVRDVLMNLPRVANLPLNRKRPAPKGGE
jgi:mono/diheme cytochrome c family protein